MPKDPWEPKLPPSFRAVPYEQVPRAGGTFFYNGEFWRAFEGGFRRQVGRAPKTLRAHLPNEQLVWKES